MTRNELKDMMYGRGFTFTMETKSYGEPMGLCFISEPVYDRRDRTKIVIPKYMCMVYPETDQFEFYTTKDFSSAYTKLSTQKYENVQDKDRFNRFASEFEDSIAKQITLKSDDALTLTEEDLKFGTIECDLMK